jgi:hypothetical protein
MLLLNFIVSLPIRSGLALLPILSLLIHFFISLTQKGLSVNSGQYPKQWRKSYTVLVFKSGDQSDLNNYRGVSLQNCMTKLFSAVLNDRLIQHYEKNLF